ncbi:MAG: hypothetical protein AAFY41_18905 [Bacteroidota bacterium]
MEREFLIESFKRHQEPWVVAMMESGDIKRVEVDGQFGTMKLIINPYHYLALSKVNSYFGRWKVDFSCEKRLRN